MKIAVMQPYFFPYIGYFQLINAVDEFVVYDNIEFTKKGWINRNRILVNGQDVYITLPLKRDSDYLDVQGRFLAASWPQERKKILNKIVNAYRKAPNFERIYSLVERCLFSNENNLFQFILNSLQQVNEYLQISTPIIVSSNVLIDHELKAARKVVEICKVRHATVYINPIGGVNLYQKSDFRREGIDLYFLKSSDIVYRQFNPDFVPWLSIIDVMMFNSKEEIKQHFISSFELI
jgi:hypothetical protein